MTKKKNELDVKNIDYDKLAIAIITEWDSDREESGRKELVKGMCFTVICVETHCLFFNFCKNNNHFNFDTI